MQPKKEDKTPNRLKRISCILVLVIYVPLSTKAQNLVQNPDFEKYSLLPSYYEFTCSNWQSVCGTVDYFNIGSIDKRRGVPNNEFGNHPAHSGKGYIGLIIFGFDGYQEFVQSKLLRPLIKQQAYKVRCYVRYSSKELCYSTWNIGVFLSASNILCINNIPDYCPKPDIELTYKDYNYLPNIHLNKYKTQVENRKGVYIKGSDWVKIEGVYLANGDEKYITLGGFYIEDKAINKILENFLNPSKKYNTKEFEKYLSKKVLRFETQEKTWDFKDYAYYFIDDISVVPVDENGNEIVLYPELLRPDTLHQHEETLNIEKLEIGESFILNNIFFEFEKSNLLPESFPVLNKLAETMQQNAIIEVEISGHTDNSGSEEYNYKLSEARAKSVVIYLIEKGIPPERLKHKGYGSSKPLSDNSTEESRAKNRRVEFTILKK